jgi:hypothetical protein
MKLYMACLDVSSVPALNWANHDLPFVYKTSLKSGLCHKTVGSTTEELNIVDRLPIEYPILWISQERTAAFS